MLAFSSPFIPERVRFRRQANAYFRVPPAEVMATFGEGHQPGGAWQRAMTLKWLDLIAPLVGEDKRVLFEGQMRIAAPADHRTEPD